MGKNTTLWLPPCPRATSESPSPSSRAPDSTFLHLLSSWRPRCRPCSGLVAVGVMCLDWRGDADRVPRRRWSILKLTKGHACRSPTSTTNVPMRSATRSRTRRILPARRRAGPARTDDRRAGPLLGTDAAPVGPARASGTSVLGALRSSPRASDLVSLCSRPHRRRRLQRSREVVQDRSSGLVAHRRLQ